MILVAPAALLGVLIGSFLNVVVHRVPRGLSIVSPPSACPGCSAAIAPRDNVPVLSWLLLRGRCRHCAMRIPIRYPLIELLTGVLFALAALHVAQQHAPDSPLLSTVLEAVAYLHLAAISVALAAIDLDVRRLPDVLVLPGYASGLLLLGAADLLRDDPVSLATACAGAGLSVALYFALVLIRPGGMGLGDVKLAGVLGLFLGQAGLPQLVVGTAAAFVLGGAFGLAQMLRGRARSGSAIAFGPWMIGGAWIGLLAGAAVAHAYLGLWGLA